MLRVPDIRVFYYYCTDTCNTPSSWLRRSLLAAALAVALAAATQRQSCVTKQSIWSTPTGQNIQRVSPPAATFMSTTAPPTAPAKVATHVVSGFRTAFICSRNLPSVVPVFHTRKKRDRVTAYWGNDACQATSQQYTLQRGMECSPHGVHFRAYWGNGACQASRQ